MLVVVRGDYEIQDESFKDMDEIFSKFGEKSVEEGGILKRMRKRKSRKKTHISNFYIRFKILPIPACLLLFILAFIKISDV